MMQRELVIDMDLNDWGKVRDVLCACGTEKTLCDTCWLLVEMAAEVCRVLLSDYYGLGPMLMTYSGGRGCHLWWGTTAARTLSHRELLLLGDTLLEYPPTFERVNRDLLDVAGHVIEKIWVARGIQGRALLADAQVPDTPGYRLWQKMLTYGPAVDVPPQPGLSPEARSRQHWEAWWTRGYTHPDARLKFLLEMGWPRIDRQVTMEKQQKVKLPFSIHKSTGRVSLPLRDAQVQQPRDIPVVQQVLRGEQAALEQWRTGVDVLDAWLTECGYN